MLGLDEAAVDSLLLEQQRGRSSARRAASVAAAGTVRPGEARILDSLIAGPLPDSTLDSFVIDTADTGRDSLAARSRRKSAVKPLPKRYEQRIFRLVDRSAFTAAAGAVGRDHVLGPGDNIIVSLWGDKEKVYDLALNPEGKAFVEGVGLVPLSGLNLNEAQARLRERLSRIYSGLSRGTTQVEVSMGRAGPLKVFVLGEVKVPGGYVFTGNTSVLTAMYFAQGPTDFGTVRDLQLTRGGRKIPLDLYQYLIHGNALNPDVLRDGDILFSGRAQILVDVQGDVGRPATYELKKGEGIRELLQFAGGLNPTAAAHRIMVQRIFAGGKVDYIDLASPADYVAGTLKAELQDGDKVLVEKSTELSKNFLTVVGPVKYPGTYSSEGISSISDLVKRAGGLREDAYLGRAHVVRFKPDGSSELFAYSLDTTQTDRIELQAKDNIILYSLKDMYIPDSIEVAGSVFNPGRYEYRRGMTAKDLIMQAGGLLPEHEQGRIFVFRGDTRERKVEQIVLNVESGLGKSSEGFVLEPRDIVHVPVDPLWYQKEVVVLAGLFKRPGKYALIHPGEKISSVIERAGGFKENAYVQGARFFRSKDSVGRVGVDVWEAHRKPRSKANIALVGGDSIHIPERLNTVKVLGEVGFETSVLFKEGKTVQYYIEKAGGFTRRSEKNNIVVQYANGETNRDGYFNRKPDAGSVIYVPQGPDPKPIEWFAGINAILGTMGVATAIILSIQAIQKN